MRAILIQNAVGECAELLRLSAPLHQAYCDRHGIELRQSYHNLAHGRSHMWDKVVLLLELLSELADGVIVFWIDADALIVGSENIAHGLPDGFDIAMFRMGPGPKGRNRLNTGVMILRNGPELRRLLKDAFDLGNCDGPLDEYTCDEPRINERLESGTYALKIHVLDVKYNSFCPYLCDEPLVRAWHGEKKRAVAMRMREELWKLRGDA